MNTVHFDVTLNKKQTKYLDPQGNEYERTSNYKKVLGDQWSKYSIGQYKGRELAFSLVEAEPELATTGYETFKKVYNLQNKKSDEGKERGTLFHEEMDIALNEESPQGGLSMLIDMDIDGEKVTNPFAPMVLEYLNNGWKIVAHEKSFAMDLSGKKWGGTIDLILKKGDNINILEFKTTKLSLAERFKYLDTPLEYGLQGAAYRLPVCIGMEFDPANVEFHILWEDGTINIFTQEHLDKLEKQFLLNIELLETTKQNTQLLKEVLSSDFNTNH